MLNKIATATAIRHLRRHRHGNSARPPAKATGLGGYTYTQRVCQEYGQQPRYYHVRDGQAAYNGGNSDSGRLIVLERGVVAAGTPDRYVLDVTLTRQQGYGRTTRFGAPRFFLARGRVFHRNSPNNYVLAPNTGQFIRIADTPWSPGDPTPNSDFIQVGTTRYRLIPGIPARGGGQYVRWAHMMWCR